MSINIIVGLDEGRIIGKGNAMPWHLPADLKHFRETTSGKVVIMGRKTFESIGSKPLPGRQNIVVSRSMPKAEGIIVAKSLEEAIRKAKSLGKDVFIMGGRSIYEQALPLADKLYISHIEGKHDGDVLFPEVEWDDWEVEKEEQKQGFLFRIYRRKA